MIWKILFYLAILIAAAGIPVLFFHPIGWGMMAAGAYLAYLTSEKALRADSKHDILKAVGKLRSIGKHTVCSRPDPFYDDWRKRLEELGFRFVADVRIASEKNALARLMCDEENKIWVVLRKSFGQVVAAFYSFGINGGVVSVSGNPMPGVTVVGRAVQEKHPNKSLPELVKIVKDRVFDLECKFPELLPVGVLSFDTPSEFLRQLDEFKIRRSLQFGAYDREKLSAWKIAPDAIDTLMKMRAVSRDEYWDYLPTKPAVRLLPAGDKSVRSRLGGLPDLPPDAEWPKTPSGKPMNFIAEIDCAELPEDESFPAMPKTGILFFFYALEDEDGYYGYNPGDDCGWRVMFLENMNGLEPRNTPDEIFVFKEFRVAGAVEKTSLGGHSYAVHDPAASYHLLFGYPDAIQSDNQPEDCAEVTASKHPSKAEDWILLLQADTDYEHSDLQFADMGTLFFWIRKEDLANRRFDRVWMIMECY